MMATQPISNAIEKITLVVNDYVVFEITRTDIVRWSPSPPVLELLEDFKGYQLFIASVSRKFAQMPILDQSAVLRFSDTKVRVYRIMGGILPHRAGRGQTMMVPFGERGWLRRDQEP